MDGERQIGCFEKASASSCWWWRGFPTPSKSWLCSHQATTIPQGLTSSNSLKSMSQKVTSYQQLVLRQLSVGGVQTLIIYSLEPNWFSYLYYQKVAEDTESLPGTHAHPYPAVSPRCLHASLWNGTAECCPGFLSESQLTNQFTVFPRPKQL